MAGKKGKKKSSGAASNSQSKCAEKIDKGKQREENLPFCPPEQPIQGDAGPSNLPLGIAPGPAYFPKLSAPAWLPEYKPLPNAYGQIRVIPEDPPMPEFTLDPNKPFTDKRRVPSPLHVRKSTGPEQIFPANVQGYQWAVAGGYDGYLLPNPPLTNMLPKGPYYPGNQGGRSGINQFEPNPRQFGEPPTQIDLAGLAQVHAYRKEFKSSNAVIPNIKLPLTRGVVVKQYKDKDDEDGPVVLPDVRRTIRLLVASLPHLSRGFLANHIISAWKDREWHAIGVPGPDYPDWTSRTIHKSRIANRGHSNGYQSFGDLAQLDFESASLKHFSIMNKEKLPDARIMCVVNREVPKTDFNIFQHLVKRPELVIIMAKYLRVQELLILYSISRPFHHIVRNRITGIIVSQAQRRAIDSAQLFPFRCFSKLCFPDPAGRPHPIPERAMAGEIRQVPSFKWLLMVCYREMVCHEIASIMAQDGVRVPDACISVLKKIWLLLDIPDSARRVGLIQNTSVFSNLDIYFGMMFFVKLDMRFTDPITGSGKDGMRRLLMAQPSLTMLWKALKRTALVSRFDIIKLFVRWKYRPPMGEIGQTIFGVPPNEIGMTQYEGWGKTQSRFLLLRPDELILKESIRRQLNLHLHYTNMFLWGYVNPITKNNVQPRAYPLALDRLEGLEEILVPKEECEKERFVLRVTSSQARGARQQNWMLH
ncbi:hypothetical protein McanMca71_000893 [Microsporum canis]